MNHPILTGIAMGILGLCLALLALHKKKQVIHLTEFIAGAASLGSCLLLATWDFPGWTTPAFVLVFVVAIAIMGYKTVAAFRENLADMAFFHAGQAFLIGSLFLELTPQRSASEISHVILAFLLVMLGSIVLVKGAAFYFVRTRQKSRQ